VNKKSRNTWEQWFGLTKGRRFPHTAPKYPAAKIKTNQYAIIKTLASGIPPLL
jgi:hypothetical protein